MSAAERPAPNPAELQFSAVGRNGKITCARVGTIVRGRIGEYIGSTTAAFVVSYVPIAGFCTFIDLARPTDGAVPRVTTRQQVVVVYASACERWVNEVDGPTSTRVWAVQL